MDSLSPEEYHAALAALKWQVELGVGTCVGDTPVNRYEVPAEKPKAAPKPAAEAPAVHAAADPVAEAEAMAAGASDLEALKAAMAAYPHCELQKGARNLVFADGMPGSALMIVGEAPGRDEDREGRPFVGRAGQLLDRMLAAIGHGRTTNTYITNVLPWRPPQNRDPKPDEIAMLLPFLKRHIALAQPKVLMVMGNIPCQALLGKRGITRLRGNWEEAAGLPALPMFHPAYLLRNPAAKREAWADLLSVQARLADG
ncbi:MAG: uracil-DNA glycosylase [Pseudomonadota bacterium]